MFDIKTLQNCTNQEQVGGWLFYNFHNLDSAANAILHIPPHAIVTRRWFYLIPATGEPVKLVHKIEKHVLDHLPGSKLEYATWKELSEQLKRMFATTTTVCMQYSPMNAIPYVSFVDAGTIELVRSLGVKVISSANLIQIFQAVWTEEGLKTHLEAAKKLRQIVPLAFTEVRQAIEQNKTLSEYQLQQFIVEQFHKLGMVYDDPPIVAVNEHSGDPHYEPTKEKSSLIRKGDLLLVDLWAKEKTEEAVYADITWVGVVAASVDAKYAKIFKIVSEGRDAAVRFIRERLANRQEVCGYEVDDACRQVIEKAGYGKYFVHRTGHSIGKEVHWKGVNIDNFETKDERKLIEGIGFSIEPGIYLPEFGIRSEVDVYIKDGKAHISGEPIQQELIPILG